MCEICMLKTTKHWWKKSNTEINGKVHCIHGLEDSVLLRGWFSLNSSINLMWKIIKSSIYRRTAIHASHSVKKF